MCLVRQGREEATEGREPW